MAVDFEAAKDGELIVKSNGAPKKSFKFDAVFGPQSSQVDVFEDTAPFAASVLDGYNVCIFAYGQTGTGKTFTMEGTDEARGVNYRTLEELFRIIKERQGLFQYEVSVSVLEVYNEQIRDLLGSGTQPGVTAKRLEVKQVGEGIHHVPGLVEANVNNMSEVWEVLQTGSNARAVGSTHANEHSSRSHCIHCVMVEGENLLNGESTRSKLWLVDLAGSERVPKAEVQGERLKETQNINRSLSALGDVISALATKSPHIPFRNSKLTHLLQDSLGGDSKTLMFVQISPNENDQSETLCSLNFASRVRGIELGPAKKQIDSSELLKYKQLVEKAKLDLKGKDVQLKKMEDTIHGLDVKMKEKDLKNKNLQDKIKELESQLLIERKLARQHVESKLGEQQQLMRQLQEEQNSAVTRPPLATRPLGLNKNFNEGKEQVNHIRPLSENNTCKLPSTPPHNDPSEKENNPDIAEQIFIPKRTGRASLCPVAHRNIPISSAPRRASLIPLPLPTILAGKKEDTEGVEAKGFPEPTPLENSPKELKSGGKKLTSALRRSLQKRIQIRSPMPQHVRRGGVNVGMEKVRVSIGAEGGWLIGCYLVMLGGL
ncbi:Minus-end-directed kinesin ATPase [Bertholletia excelsa]